MTDRELHLTASYRCVDRCRAASCIQRVLSLSLRVCAQRARPRVVDLKSTGIEFGRPALWMQGICRAQGRYKGQAHAVLSRAGGMQHYLSPGRAARSVVEGKKDSHLGKRARTI